MYVHPDVSRELYFEVFEAERAPSSSKEALK